MEDLSRVDLESLHYAVNAAGITNLLLVTSTGITRSAREMISILNDRGAPSTRVFVWTADDLLRLLPRFPSLIDRFFKPEPEPKKETYSPVLDRLAKLYKQVTAAREGGNTNEKGDALESLAAELFSSLDGWSCPKRRKRTGSNEIDCVFRNENTSHPLLREMGTTIPAECKCVTEPIGAREVQVFDAVVRECGASYGLFITTDRFTGSGNADHRLGDAILVVKNAFRDGRHLICLDGEDLKKLSVGANLLEILWTKVEDIRTS